MTEFRKSTKAMLDADAKIQDADRYRCHYAIDGIRCSALGTICEFPSGPEKGEEDRRRWLCLAHYCLRDDPLGSREALADMAAHFPKRTDNWREKMLEDVGLEELQQAWRDMDRDEKRNLVAETVRKPRAFVWTAVIRQQETSPRSARDIGLERERQLDAIYRSMTPEERADYDGRMAKTP